LQFVVQSRERFVRVSGGNGRNLARRASLRTWRGIFSEAHGRAPKKQSYCCNPQECFHNSITGPDSRSFI
jgi:hypothetical protein